MAQEPGDAVNPRPAGDVEQDAGVVERIDLGQPGGDVLRPPRQGQGERPGRRLAPPSPTRPPP